jgi:catechol 2,3-dioxygenase-like lactoylglutathione lyase family enzyme
MQLDHLVLWVEDPLRSAEFFERVVGLAAVRIDEYRAKQTLFPSVRVNESTIIDLIPRSAVPMISAIPGAAGTAGHLTNHICLAMTEAEFHALKQRLEEHGTPPGRFMENQFGARGLAPRAFYFKDLDGNVLEARHYE